MVGGPGGRLSRHLPGAVAPSISVVLAGWCVAQLSFSALQAALVAVLPDQVPVAQRGTVSGVLGVCVPIASVLGTFLVQLFPATRSPCSWRRARSAASSSCSSWPRSTIVGSLRGSSPPGRCATSSARSTSTRVAAPTSPGLSSAASSSSPPSPSLTTYQAYYLIARIGSAEDRGTRTRSSSPRWSSRSFSSSPPSSVAGSRTGAVGARSSSPPRSLIYGVALFVVAVASDFDGFLVGMAISGLGFGIYMAVDLALVTDVLPNADDVAKDLGVFNMANALPLRVRAGRRTSDPRGVSRKLRRAVRRRRALRRPRRTRDRAGQGRALSRPRITT